MLVTFRGYKVNTISREMERKEITRREDCLINTKFSDLKF